jgi:hypothetical protein
MIIWYKDNLSFIYNNMDSLRKEIEDELKRTRLDKTRLYSLLLKIIDNTGTGGPGGVGPQGPAGDKGSSCTCKCVSKDDTSVKEKATNVTSVKKAPVKKKAATTTTKA